VSRKGAVIDGLQFLKPLGEGPFGIVWLAKDIRRDATITVKCLKPSIMTQPTGRETFARLQAGVKSYAAIHHPNVCAVLRSVQSTEEKAYGLVSEHVDGQSLNRLQLSLTGPERSAIDPRRLARLVAWFEQLSSIIAWLHARGIIHGNLKPSNVMLLQGSNASQLKILDIAWSAIGVAMPSQGAPTFLAPEQLRGSPPTHQSDQYSLMLMLQRFIIQGGRRLSAEDGVPLPLVQVIDRATKQMPDARHRNMAEVEAVLRGVRRSLLGEASSVKMRVPEAALSTSAAPQSAPDLVPEPATVRMPRPDVVPRSARPEPARSGRPSRTEEKQRSRAPVVREISDPGMDITGDFEAGDFIAQVDSEPSLDLDAISLPPDAELAPGPVMSSRSSAGPTPLMIIGAALLAVVAGIGLYAWRKLGSEPTAGASVQAAEQKQEPPRSPPAPPPPTKTEEPKKIAEKPPEPPPATPPKTTPPPTHGDSVAATAVKPAPPKEELAPEAPRKGVRVDGRAKKTKAARALDEKADQAMARLEALSNASAKTSAPPEAAGPDGATIPERKALEVSCDEGDGGACAKLGDSWKTGKGGPKSDDKARSAYERACSFGRAESCHKAADMFAQGKGGAASNARAKELEAAACKHGRKGSCKLATKTSSAS
jgi:serine/threonine protein kinase